jgi:hypothetical protein
MIRRVSTIALAMLLAHLASAQEFDPGAPNPQQAPDEQQIQEREQAQKLRRSPEELEMRRNEDARMREAEQLRQFELQRLEDARAAIGRRESYLGGEIYWTQRERDSVQWKDPADLSSMARRSNLDHQLYQQRNELYQRRTELDRAGTLRQGLTNPSPLNILR